jgi:hypothetical protein
MDLSFFPFLSTEQAAPPHDSDGTHEDGGHEETDRIHQQRASDLATMTVIVTSPLLRYVQPDAVAHEKQEERHERNEQIVHSLLLDDAEGGRNTGALRCADHPVECTSRDEVGADAAVLEFNTGRCLPADVDDGVT